MLRIRKLVTPERKNAFISRLDPRAKILLVLAVGVAAISLDEPDHLLALFLLALLGQALARFEADKYKLMAVVLIIGLWGVSLSQALFYAEWPRTVIVTLIPDDFPVLGALTGGVYIYKEGFIHGLVQGLRFTTMTTFGLLVTWSTDPRDILLGLTQMRVPYGMAFMFITAVRFLPILAAEIFTVLAVQRLRGANPTKLGRHTIRNAIRVLTPVLANCVRRAATLGASCESRAFNPSLPRTSLREIHWHWTGLLICSASLTPALLLICTKILFWLYQAEVLYVSDLRWLYQIAREL